MAGIKLRKGYICGIVKQIDIFNRLVNEIAAENNLRASPAVFLNYCLKKDANIEDILKGEYEDFDYTEGGIS